MVAPTREFAVSSLVVVGASTQAFGLALGYFVERGLPDKQIAADLQISVKTVEKHVGAILRKTGASNRTMLASRSALHPR